MTNCGPSALSVALAFILCILAGMFFLFGLYGLTHDIRMRIFGMPTIVVVFSLWSMAGIIMWLAGQV